MLVIPNWECMRGLWRTWDFKLGAWYTQNLFHSSRFSADFVFYSFLLFSWKNSDRDKIYFPLQRSFVEKKKTLTTGSEFFLVFCLREVVRVQYDFIIFFNYLYYCWVTEISFSPFRQVAFGDNYERKKINRRYVYAFRLRLYFRANQWYIDIHVYFNFCLLPGDKNDEKRSRSQNTAVISTTLITHTTLSWFVIVPLY